MSKEKTERKDTTTHYSVYILECSDKSLYTGITTDIKRRLYEHNHTLKGAKYTKARRPVKLVYCEKNLSKSDALQKEYAIKKLKKIEKLKIIEEKSLENNHNGC